MSEEGEKTCPLCAEEMDLTDQQLKPCKCGYEVCKFVAIYLYLISGRIFMHSIYVVKWLHSYVKRFRGIGVPLPICLVILFLVFHSSSSITSPPNVLRFFEMVLMCLSDAIVSCCNLK